MDIKPNKHIIITGHYGSGKTNIAVSIALMLAGKGYKCALADIDTVNPYFRAFDAAPELEKAGVKVIAPFFANSNLDVPALPAEINTVFDSNYDYAVFDVGGDDAGAYALGGYSDRIKKQGYTMYYIINKYRPLTEESGEAAEILTQIEAASRLKATGIINNSNLGKLTDEKTVLDSLDYANSISEKMNLPVVYTTVIKELVPELKLENMLEIDIHTKARNLFSE